MFNLLTFLGLAAGAVMVIDERRPETFANVPAKYMPYIKIGPLVVAILVFAFGYNQFRPLTAWFIDAAQAWSKSDDSSGLQQISGLFSIVPFLAAYATGNFLFNLGNKKTEGDDE